MQGITSSLTMSKQPVPELVVPVIDDSDLILDTGVTGRKTPPPIAEIDKNEPVVTRRELWSYYRMSQTVFPDENIVYSIPFR